MSILRDKPVNGCKMASVLIYIALAIAAIVLYFYNKLNKSYSYFKDRGIPQLQPDILYGNAKDLIQKKLCQGHFYKDIYNKFKKLGIKQGGIYISKIKIWVPIDPELIKTILTKDFPSFSAHYPKYKNSPMFNNLFLMDGEEWKDMRKKLTPTFTSGKMKMMYNIILEKSNGLSDLVNKSTKMGEPIEMKEALARYTTDIIGSCGFGIECNSIEDKASEFFRQGQNIFREGNDEETDKKDEFSLFRVILASLGLLRGVNKHVDFSLIENFFRNVVKDTIDYREKNKIVRNDFLHLMIQLKNKGAVTEMTNDNEDIYKKTVEKEAISLDEITGQCLLFFNAGFETSSTTMTYALLELTQNQDIQKKLRLEVRKVLEKHKGQLTYEALQEMTYCDNVIHETLRKYPAVPILPRMCTKKYTIPGTNSVIDPWTMVTIPVLGLHMDPEYFPDPEKFNPDRFNTENKSKIQDFTYIPFGEGPRMCLGLRFGIMQTKTGLVKLINNYNFTLNKKTPYPPEYEKGVGIISKAAGGIWLNVTKVD